MLVFVPAVRVVEMVAPNSHTLLFVLAVRAVVPLAAVLSHATEAVAAKTGDAVGGLLKASLGNLSELMLRAGCTPLDTPIAQSWTNLVGS
jgi:Ca2+:H+ antiporter